MDRRQRAWVALCSFVLLGVQSSNLSAAAHEFRVGDARGWSVPSGRNQTDVYNQWAGRNRFQVGDTLLFKYNRSSDSVVQVNTAEEYRSCNTSKSVRTFTDGNTVFKLERSGAFYFITGASGSCKKGLKMILVVMARRGRALPAPAPSPSPSMALAPRPQLASSPVPSMAASPSPTPSMGFGGPARAPNADSPSPSPSPGTPAMASSPSPSMGLGGPASPSHSPHSASPPAPLTANTSTSPRPAAPSTSPGTPGGSDSAALAPSLLTILVCFGLVVFL